MLLTAFDMPGVPDIAHAFEARPLIVFAAGIIAFFLITAVSAIAYASPPRPRDPIIAHDEPRSPAMLVPASGRWSALVLALAIALAGMALIAALVLP